MIPLARRIIRWSAIALNAAATCYYGVAMVRFVFTTDYPLADKLGLILSFNGFVFVSGFFAPALAVMALLMDSIQRSPPSSA